MYNTSKDLCHTQGPSPVTRGQEPCGPDEPVYAPLYSIQEVTIHLCIDEMAKTSKMPQWLLAAQPYTTESVVAE